MTLLRIEKRFDGLFCDEQRPILCDTPEAALAALRKRMARTEGPDRRYRIFHEGAEVLRVQWNPGGGWYDMGEWA